MAWEEGYKVTYSAPLFSRVSFSISTSEQGKLLPNDFCVDGFLPTPGFSGEGRGEQGRVNYLDEEQFNEGQSGRFSRRRCFVQG